MLTKEVHARNHGKGEDFHFFRSCACQPLGHVCSNSMKKKPVRGLGELALIDRIQQKFAGAPSRGIRLGIGDDCAILQVPAESEVLVTTDFSLEGRHFRREWHSPESIGHRCLARGLSDLAAMGAEPVAAFLSLALPAGVMKSWIDRFFKGLRSLADRYAVPLAGGDTAQAPAELILADIVLIGSAPAGRALWRSGASVGDRIYVTGALGGAAAELERMQAGRVRRMRSGAWSQHPQMFPEPRLGVGQWLLKKNVATACIDLSDGLSTDIAHLCSRSRVGAEIDAAALPLHSLAMKLLPEKRLHAALHGGEDYELLFTAAPAARVPRQIAGVGVTPIGRITRTGVTLLDEDGRGTKLLTGGWEHFKTQAVSTYRKRGRPIE
jgi:thiamine-monophosphate kinase